MAAESGSGVLEGHCLTKSRKARGSHLRGRVETLPGTARSKH